MKAVVAAVFIERKAGSVFVFINGRPAAELEIDRRVSDGKIYIASGLSANAIESFRKDWPSKN